MHTSLFILFWGSLVLATLAIALHLLIPKYRKQLKIQSIRASLEERYSKEIAAGTAVIIPRHPKMLKVFLLQIAFAAVLVITLKQLKTLDQTCTGLAGWHSIFIYLGMITIVSLGGSLILLITSYLSYQRSLQDGFVPSRQTKAFHDRISFQLTKQRKIKEQLKLTVFFILCILLICIPFQMLNIFMNIPNPKPSSIYELNEILQKTSLENLEKNTNLKQPHK